MRPRWRLVDLFVLMTAAAVIAVLVLYFTNWSDYLLTSPLLRNHRHFFSLNLLLLTTATLASFLGYALTRRFAAGYAAFGWVYLICVLRGSFIETANYDLWIHGKASVMGIAYSVLAGIVAYYVLPPAVPKKEKKSE
jgi:hypothetical protein